MVFVLLLIILLIADIQAIMICFGKYKSYEKTKDNTELSSARRTFFTSMVISIAALALTAFMVNRQICEVMSVFSDV